MQICEYRELRQSLMVQVMVGVCVLGFRISGPQAGTDFGVVPAGVLLSMDQGNGPGVFRLSRQLDGDMVIQAWFAWVVPASLSGGTVVQFTASGTWTAPASVFSVLAECVGGGGGGWDGFYSLVTQNGGGAGGSGAYGNSTIAVTPGNTYTVTVGASGLANGAGVPTASWFSNTNAIPVFASQGALGAPGGNAPGTSSGADSGLAGSQAACVGQTTQPGFGGGQGVVSGGSGGGGDYIFAGFPQNGNITVTGRPGSSSAPAPSSPGGAQYGGDGGAVTLVTGGTVDGFAGIGPGGGGGGGGWDGGAGVAGVGANGFSGIVQLTLLPTIIITVIEAFDLPASTEPPSRITAELPELSAPGELAARHILRTLPVIDDTEEVSDEAL